MIAEKKEKLSDSIQNHLYLVDSRFRLMYDTDRNKTKNEKAKF